MSDQPEAPINEIRSVDIGRAARYALACQVHDRDAMEMIVDEVLADESVTRLTTALASQAATFAAVLAEIIGSATFQLENPSPMAAGAVASVKQYSGDPAAILMELIAASQRS